MNRSTWLWGLLAILVAAAFWLYPRNRHQQNAFAARELATRKLGQHLAAKFPGARVLILSNPFVPMGIATPNIQRMESAAIDGLKDGLAGKLSVQVVYPELTPEGKSDPLAVLEDKETSTPLSFLLADDAFDRIMTTHPQCDLFISFIGLPDNIEDLQCWRAQGKPAFALLLPDLRLLGGAPAIQRAMKRGKVVAFIMNKPGAPDSRAPVSSGENDFDSRFLLVTGENIDDTIRAYPQPFAGD